MDRASQLIIALFDLSLFVKYITISFIIAIIIQTIVYRLTGFSIYKYLIKKLILDQLK